MGKQDYYVTCDEAQRITGYARNKTYRLLKTMNRELEAKGYLTVHGSVPRSYFFARLGLDDNVCAKSEPENGTTQA